MVSPFGSWLCRSRRWRDGVLHDVNGGRHPAELPDRRDSSAVSGRVHLVGRDEPLGRLKAALDSALAGRGQAVLVAGEPGIGKTALLGALADEAADRSVVVAWGQCWDDSMAPPFWPWTQVLRELGHATNPLSPARLPATADQAMADGAVDRFALFDAVGMLLIGMAEAYGLVVVLDDLHCAAQEQDGEVIAASVTTALWRPRVETGLARSSP